eukprot:s1_g773.t1
MVERLGLVVGAISKNQFVVSFVSRAQRVGELAFDGVAALTSLQAVGLVAFAFAVAGVCVSTFLGQDFGPDLINYHHYTGDAVLNGSNQGDYFVAALQGFFNPLPSVPYVWFFQTFPPIVAGGLLGAIHAQIGTSGYLLTLSLMKADDKALARILAVAAGVLAFMSPFVIGTVGGSFSDTPQSIAVLSAAALFIYCFRRQAQVEQIEWRLMFGLLAAGAIAGGGAGVKVSHFFTATAFIPVVLVAMWLVGMRRGAAVFGSFGAGGLIGVAAVNAWWFSKSYEATGSPVYPYLQEFFPSNAVGIFTGGSPGLNFPAWAAVKNIEEFLWAPWEWAHGNPPPTEWLFADNRMLIFWISAILLSLLSLICWTVIRYSLLPSLKHVAVEFFDRISTAGSSRIWVPGVALLCVYFVAAYIPWIFTLGSIRYAIAIFGVAGVLMVILIAALVRTRTSQVFVASILVISVFLGLRSVYYGRLAWDDSWATEALSTRVAEESALYIMDANSFWVPKFHADSVFIRLADLLGGGDLLTQASNDIDAYPGKIRLLLGAPYGGYINNRQSLYGFLADRGLSIDMDSCSLEASIYSFHVCDVLRKDGKAIASQPIEISFGSTLPAVVQAVHQVGTRHPFGRQTNDAHASIVFNEDVIDGALLSPSVSSNTPVVSPSFVEFQVGDQVFGQWLSVYSKSFRISRLTRENNVLIINDSRRCLPRGFLNSPYASFPRVNLLSMTVDPGGADPAEKMESMPANLPDIGDKVLDLNARDDLSLPLSEVVSGIKHVVSPDGAAAFVASGGEEISFHKALQPGSYRLRMSVASPTGLITVPALVGGTEWSIRSYACFATYSIPFDITNSGAQNLSMRLGDGAHALALERVEIFQVPDSNGPEVFEVSPSARSQDIGYVNFGYPSASSIWMEADEGRMALPIAPSEGSYVRLSGGMNPTIKDSVLSVSVGDQRHEFFIPGGQFDLLVPAPPTDAPLRSTVNIEVDDPNRTLVGVGGGRLYISSFGLAPSLNSKETIEFDFSLADGSDDDLVGLTGFSTKEASGRWTDGNSAELYFPMDLPADFNLEISGFAFAENSREPIKFTVGETVVETLFDEQPGTRVLAFRGVQGAANRVLINVPAPTAPADTGAASADRRKLGLFVQQGPEVRTELMSDNQTGILEKRPKRVFWLGMHKVLSQTELPRLRQLGYEVFNPQYLSDVYDQSAVYGETELVNTTLPAEALDVLRKTNFFYDKIPGEAAEILNEYFDAAIVTINPLWLANFLEAYHGKVIYRVYGQPYSLSVELLNLDAFPRVVERENFWFSPHTTHTLDIEDDWLLTHTKVVPYCLPQDIVDERDTWNLDDTSDSVALLCPRAIDVPYYADNYRHLLHYFPDKRYKIFGAQNIEISGEKVVGTLSREHFISRLRGMRGFTYHYHEPTVCYLPPIEFMTLGGPVAFQAGSLLGRYFEGGSPGEAKDIKELVDVAEKIRHGDKTLISEIIDSQKPVRELYQPEFVWPRFDAAFKDMLESSTEAISNSFLYAPSLAKADNEQPAQQKMPQEPGKVVIPFHGFGPSIIKRDGKYHSSEGIARVVRQFARALTENGAEIIVTARYQDMARVWEFFISGVSDKSKVKVLSIDVDEPPAPGTQGTHIGISQRIKRFVLKVMDLTRKVNFHTSRHGIGREFIRSRLHRLGLPKWFPAVLLVPPFLLFALLIRLITSMYSRIFPIALQLGYTPQRKYVDLIERDTSISTVLIPHYHMFPELIALKRPHTVLYLPDYMPHFYPSSAEMGAAAANKVVGRKLVEAASRVITNSAFTKSYLPDSDLKVLERQIAHIPLPYLNKDAADQAENQSGREIDTKLPDHYVFYPTRDRPSKRLADFVKSVRRVNQTLADRKTGQRVYGVLTSPLKTATVDFPLMDEIIVINEVTDDELQEIYKNALALLFTSEMEGNFPTQVTEALYLRVPVVASKMPLITSELGELSEALELSEIGDCPGYVESILRILEDRNAAVQRQEKVREFAIENFSYENFKRQLISAMN